MVAQDAKVSLALLLMLALHAVLVPVAVMLTNAISGDIGVITIANQNAWLPIVSAQSTLLSVYLAFGSGTMIRRLALFTLGGVWLAAMQTVGYGMLSGSAESRLQMFTSWMPWHLYTTTMPAALCGGLMLAVRDWFGAVTLRPTKESLQRLSVGDLLLITTCVCLATMAFGYLSEQPFGQPNSRVSDLVPLSAVLLKVAYQIPMAMSLVWLCFAARGQYIAMAVFMLMAGVSLRGGSLTSLGYMAYWWGVVAATLLAFRWLGYRLRSVFCSFPKHRDQQQSSTSSKRSHTRTISGEKPPLRSKKAW